MFQPDKMYDISWDTGDKTFQCGRRVDVLKLWLMWKAKVRKIVLLHDLTEENVYMHQHNNDSKEKSLWVVFLRGINK